MEDGEDLTLSQHPGERGAQQEPPASPSPAFIRELGKVGGTVEMADPPVGYLGAVGPCGSGDRH